MKSPKSKELTWGILGSALVLLLTGYFYYHYFSQINLLVINNLNTAIPSAGEPIQLTLDEVGRHNTAKDCWLIINQKVYAVSDYLALHPGGKDTIIPCGKDATSTFLTKGGRGSHSSLATQQLTSLLLGQIGTTINSGQVQTVKKNAASQQPQREGEIEDD